MSAPVCTSQAQCRLNGLFGTAVALCTAMLAWVAVDLMSAGLSGAALLWMLPPALAVALWAGLRLTGTPPCGITATLACAGAAWGVLALNLLERS